MNFVTIIGLSMAMFLLAATPGPGVLSVIARSLATGFKSSLSLIAGIVTGDTIFLFFSVFGLTFIARTMGDLFIIIKYAGSFYLIFLGVKILISRKMPENVPVSKRGNFISGLTITLSNPKVILFYCGFLPNFMDLAKLNKTDIFITTVVIVTVLTSVLTFYAFLSGYARRMIKNRKSVKIINSIAGTVMISSGVAIATRS